MNAKTINLFQQFVGKVCSVFTHPINRNFDEQRSREHFVVKVTHIDADAVWGVHPYNGTLSYFNLSHVILITEEIVLDPNNPDHAKMIKQYQEKTGETIISDVSPHLAPTIPSPGQLVQIDPIKQTPAPAKQEPAFVNIKYLNALAKKTKESFETQEVF